MYGRVVDIPNKKKKKDSCFLEYDLLFEDKIVVDKYTTALPNTKKIKNLIKKVFLRADIAGYRFLPKRKIRRREIHLCDLQMW